ncbi:glycosyltransferase [Psychrobacter sp. ANT_WB68]|nr:glycosyltransferase [Psychrobacter sp. ANT_WB68]
METENLKILLYNYVQFDDIERRGGGVTVYLANLVKSLLQSNHEVIFLSSGNSYDIKNSKPRLDIKKEGNLTRCIVYNSPFLAPASSSFYEPEVFTNSNSLDKIAHEIFQRFSDIDVFHFNNIEGLTYGFIKELRESFILSNFIYSVHNYNLLCMQVNLWFNDKENCQDFEEGSRCLNCNNNYNSFQSNLIIKKIQTTLSDKMLGKSALHKNVYLLTKKTLHKYRYLNHKIYKKKNRIPTVNIENNSAAFRDFREKNIQMCNDIFDKIICVSERTKDIMKRHGVKENKLNVVYIGTSFYDVYKSAELKKGFEKCLTIGYLGYMRKDKGFDFFINSIDKMDLKAKKNINIIIAAHCRDKETAEKLKSLSDGFNSFKVYDGYTHESLPLILEEIDLGIVPVQWEDNLPQVAIEYVCNGIPVLTSNLGGASEIAENPHFIFRHDDKKDFINKISNFLNKEVELKDFWKKDLNVFSMSDHMNKIIKDVYSISN